MSLTFGAISAWRELVGEPAGPGSVVVDDLDQSVALAAGGEVCRCRVALRLSAVLIVVDPGSVVRWL